MDLLGTEKVYGCIPFQPVCFITIPGLVANVPSKLRTCLRTAGTVSANRKSALCTQKKSNLN